ncbi:MAG: NAD-dependent epimerase/dehydratase family protein, partial [Rubrobacteraceae bacterium]
MRYLVVGGNGFIGGHVVKRLAENDGEVRVYDRSPGQFRALPEGT